AGELSSRDSLGRIHGSLSFPPYIRDLRELCKSRKLRFFFDVLYDFAHAVSRSPKVAEVLDTHVAIGKARGDLQLAAHRLDEAAERAHIHIRALLDLGDGGLLDVQ